ncbi:hypothetical protein BDZ45DRAFT_807870 [Acephala macrosclerotiorum]|nr:hypothetical protein BDZ45DRAFT_807870 [Acephala macrosclerotiorum]
MANGTSFLFLIPTLSNACVKLTLFIPARHASAYFRDSSSHPGLYVHMTPGPFQSEKHFIKDFIEGMSNRHIETLTFAVIDKTRPASEEDAERKLASMISSVNTQPRIYPQRLASVVWNAVSTNAASLRVAERMGLWNLLFRNGKQKSKEGNGCPSPKGNDEDDVWRDTIVLAQCWDDWEYGSMGEVGGDEANHVFGPFVQQ